MFQVQSKFNDCQVGFVELVLEANISPYLKVFVFFRHVLIWQKEYSVNAIENFDEGNLTYNEFQCLFRPVLPRDEIVFTAEKEPLLCQRLLSPYHITMLFTKHVFSSMCKITNSASNSMKQIPSEKLMVYSVVKFSCFMKHRVLLQLLQELWFRWIESTSQLYFSKTCLMFLGLPNRLFHSESSNKILYTFISSQDEYKLYFELNINTVKYNPICVSWNV